MHIKKALLDTNILVPLEDQTIVPESYSALIRKLQEIGSDFFVHEASFDDIRRDANAQRREVSLSKLKKYQVVAKSYRTESQLSDEFGTISKINDYSDCHILAALADDAVEVLITEDNNLHRRASKIGLSDRVYRIRQLLDLLTEKYATQSGTLTFVESKFCHQIDRTDPIFVTLKQDYTIFDSWWQKCCLEHRKCWVVYSESLLAGLVVYKDESTSNIRGTFGSCRVLKLCTFKVSEQHRGGRLGEQLLKQAVWHAVSNKFDVVYVEAYERQESLIDMLLYFGFTIHSEREGQKVIVKDFRNEIPEADPYRWHLSNYPKLSENSSSLVVVPIRAEFHKRLLPEATTSRTYDLFEKNWIEKNKDSFIPTTSIRKVYVCKAPLQNILPGTQVFFYLGQTNDIVQSQSLTAAGIVESYVEAKTIEELVLLTAKRSVYSLAELKSIFDSEGKTRVLNFIVCGVCSPSIKLNNLISLGILKSAPQSILNLSQKAIEKLKESVKFSNIVLDK